VENAVIADKGVSSAREHLSITRDIHTDNALFSVEPLMFYRFNREPSKGPPRYQDVPKIRG
jgi:hypothetical protein